MNDEREIHGQNLTFYFFRKVIKVEDIWVSDGSLELAVEPENRAVVLSEATDLNSIHKRYRSGLTSLKVLEQPFRSSFCGILFKKYSPFHKVVNEQILRMFETGIVQYNKRRSEKSNDFKNVDEEIGPQVLTMDHLGIGFIFCFIPLGVGVVLLVAEILISQTKMFLHKLLLLCAVNALLRGRIHRI